MIAYLARRFATMLVTLAVISALVFFIINLPPGNYLSNQIAEMQATGEGTGAKEAEALIAQYSLDKPIWQQYFIWVGMMPGPDGFDGLLQGNLGWSFELERPVGEVVGETAWLTILVNLSSLLFVYVVALPLGTIAAVRANSWIDYTCSLIGYIGLATPNFLLALIMLFYGARYFDIPIGGLMAREFEGEAMSMAKMGSILTHLIVPTIVIGTSAAAAVMRRLRANLMDELNKPYVETARAKGVPPVPRIIRYPLRMALNPFVADIGNLAPQLVSGSVMISVVMSLPTIGPILLQALKSQDIFMAGFILLFVSILTLVGMLISDILLALLDPRIRLTSAKRGREMTDQSEHYVAPDDYDAEIDRQSLDRADFDAPTRVLVWRRFKRHRLGVVCALFLAALYAMLPFMETIAPYAPNSFDENNIFAPPQGLYLYHNGEYVGLHTYPTATVYDPHTGLVKAVSNEHTVLPVPVLTTCGEPYRILGLVESRFHLICPPEGGELFLLGSDRLGRDVLSRVLHGARLSLTIGLIGVTVSFAIGLTLGGMAGYFGGWIDATVQRAIEVFRSLPELPIWLALSAAVPVNWDSLAVFAMISVILGLLDWPGLARAVRSKFLALREEDYVRAAELMGASPGRVIRAHMMPNFMSHLIASASLSIPAMILGETALSFLGFGIRPPSVSWGLMLNDALDAGLGALEIYPWILAPMVPVILVVLAFSFVGDALRDALDPYS